MLKKIKDWVGSNLDVYKVENASDVGAGLVRHIWKGEETASQIGTTLTAQIMNDLQKGLVHTLNATKTTGTNKDIYEVALGGVEEFGVFDGLKLLVRIDGENQFEDVFLKLGGTEYQIHQLKNNLLDKVDKGILKDKKEYLLNFKNNSFVLSDSTLYGLQKGTALEGNRLAEIIGMEFGGNIQDVSNKTKGKFYYDNVTKFYYECIENTNLTYNDATKFRAISNKPISDRVEGLLEIGSNHIKFSNGIILGFGTCIASPAGTVNNYGTNLGAIVSLVLTVNGGAYIASGETISGTAFKARTNAPGSVSASYLAIGKWR